MPRTKVFLTSAGDSAHAIQSLLDQTNLSDLAGKRVALKANYNSADPFPASTSLDTLQCLVKELKARGGGEIALGERSGMGRTREVLSSRGVFKLGEELGFSVQVLDDLPEQGWVRFKAKGLHWKHGFLMARLFVEADGVVQTCCLKTHQFGGHFTLSLKNSVGMVARFDPKDNYDYMEELHSSPIQRLLIAELNTAYRPRLVLMDGAKAFVRGGPAKGDLVATNVMLAGTDRVAMDAVGVAILRHFGTTSEVSAGDIFSQAQLARAAELGLGVRSPSDIQLEPLDAKAVKLSSAITTQFGT
jgi:uncharacterized protein (DUF362 family)